MPNRTVEYEVAGTGDVDGHHTMILPDYVTGEGATALYVNSGLMDKLHRLLRGGYPNATVTGYLPEVDGYEQPPSQPGDIYTELANNENFPTNDQEAFSFVRMLNWILQR